MMKVRWQVIVAVMLICVLVFFVTNSVFAKLKVEKPLNDLLENHSEVLEYRIDEDKDINIIYLTLENPNNPFKLHKKLSSDIRDILSQEFIIIYENQKPNEGTLEWEKYWRANAIISETVITNNYALAMEKLDEKLGKENYYFLIEDDQLFISYTIGDANYFEVYNLERGA